MSDKTSMHIYCLTLAPSPGYCCTLQHGNFVSAVSENRCLETDSLARREMQTEIVSHSNDVFPLIII